MAGISENLQSRSSFSLVAPGSCLWSSLFMSWPFLCCASPFLITAVSTGNGDRLPPPSCDAPREGVSACWQPQHELRSQAQSASLGAGDFSLMTPPSPDHGGRADRQMKGPTSKSCVQCSVLLSPRRPGREDTWTARVFPALLSVPAPPPLSFSPVRDPLSCWGAGAQY